MTDPETIAAQKARAEAAERERDEARDTSTLGYWGRAYAHSNNKRIELQDKLQTSEAARDAALSRVAQLGAALGEYANRKNWIHCDDKGTYRLDPNDMDWWQGTDGDGWELAESALAALEAAGVKGET